MTGLSVAGLGDMNGDGLPDLAISVQRGTSFIVYVMWGEGVAATDVSLSDIENGVKGFRIFGEQGYYTGLSISKVGDVNKDGSADLIVGAIPFPGSLSTEQRSYLIFGNSNFTKGTADIVLGLPASSSADNRVIVIAGGGFIVAGPGDVNGDGFDDIMIVDVNNYLYKESSYVIFYPRHLSAPPTLMPSPMPSSPPYTSSMPSSSFPQSGSSMPSSKASLQPSTINQSGSSMPSSNALQQPLTINPTVSPSPLPSRAPSRYPTVIRSRSPTATLTPSNHMDPLLSLNPTASPTVAASSLLLPRSEYHIRTVNLSSARINGVFYGNDGENEIFEISSLSKDGSRNSGWSGTIIGGTGSKVYVIYPKDPSQPANTIVIADFDSSTDVIDLSHITGVGSEVDLSSLTPPLTYFLPDNQKIVLANILTTQVLSDKNFLFQSSLATNNDSSSSSRIDIFDSSLLIPLIVLVVIMIFVVAFYRSGESEEKKKKEKSGKVKPNNIRGNDAIERVWKESNESEMIERELECDESERLADLIRFKNYDIEKNTENYDNQKEDDFSSSEINSSSLSIEEDNNYYYYDDYDDIEWNHHSSFQPRN